jgi:hypothetical protein
MIVWVEKWKVRGLDIVLIQISDLEYMSLDDSLVPSNQL